MAKKKKNPKKPVQRWKLYQDRKYEAFKSLMAHRKNEPQQLDFSLALNCVQVLWGKNKKISQRYLEYHNIVKSTVNPDLWESLFLELLLEIAHDVGHKHLSKSDLQKCLGVADLDWNNRQNNNS